MFIELNLKINSLPPTISTIIAHYGFLVAACLQEQSLSLLLLEPAHHLSVNLTGGVQYICRLSTDDKLVNQETVQKELDS